jgi:hypothetical protein
MDDATISILQGILDLSKQQSKDIAKLNAFNAVFHPIILNVVFKTDVLENLMPEAKEALSSSLSSAEQMMAYDEENESFRALVSMIRAKIS